MSEREYVGFVTAPASDKPIAGCSYRSQRAGIPDLAQSGSSVIMKLSALRVVWCLVLVLPVAAAEKRNVSGIVADENNAPLSDVCIDHYGAIYCNTKTDSAGRFEISTSAPAIVFRKPGYAPQRLILGPVGEGLQVRLQSSEIQAPICASACTERIRGYFCLPQVKGVRVSKLGHDVDYSQQNHFVKVGRNRGGIVHGSGSAWSFGLPDNHDVWGSVGYSENDYTWGTDISIVDARGQMKDGSKWRFVGLVGESASYTGVQDQQIAALLDQVLDGFCVTH